MRLLERIARREADGFRPFADADIEQSIPQRFERQVRAHGDGLAVKWSGGSYTFNALNETANRLARAILAVRKPGTEPIALMFDHGGEILAAIVAVLKAGKFYVVLDPTYPPDRLEQMLRNSGSRLIIAGANHVQHARDLCDGGSIDILDFDHIDGSLAATDLGSYPTPDSLALILYTSGSTGLPKGAVHSHRNVLADVRNLTNGLGVTAKDRWLLSASFSFANSVRTIYTGLLNGSAVFPFDVRKDGFPALADWLRDNEITVIRGVPTFFRAFMATLADDLRFPSVRVLSLGGESMLGADLDRFNRHFPPHCVLAHAFGPTECLTVCWSLIPHGTLPVAGKLPIGHALPDKEVLLVDESGIEVPDGEVGEIAVRSPYISPGYWRDAQRTRAVFLPDANGGDCRVYRTGDLGRRTADGLLVHVGRRDFQVKIRGHRVEIAEVEHALRTLHGVRDAVVVGHEMAPGEQQLIAYFVPTVQPPASADALRRQLARLLPDYMRPSFFVPLDAIPQTPNGKADRLRLPLPATRRSGEREAEPRIAGATIESELAALWSEILGVPRVRPDERFLDLGGDSLTASQITARIAARFKVAIPAGVLLESTTVAQLAEAVAARQ
jgi:amino acid adenylation domain-containing protein